MTIQSFSQKVIFFDLAKEVITGQKTSLGTLNKCLINDLKNLSPLADFSPDNLVVIRDSILEEIRLALNEEITEFTKIIKEARITYDSTVKLSDSVDEKLEQFNDFLESKPLVKTYHAIQDHLTKMELGARANDRHNIAYFLNLSIEEQSKCDEDFYFPISQGLSNFADGNPNLHSVFKKEMLKTSRRVLNKVH